MPKKKLPVGIDDLELCKEYMGKFPVIFLSLKGADGLNFEEAYDALRRVIRAEISRFGYLIKEDCISENVRLLLERFLREQETKGDTQESLKILSSLLYQHYRQKVILLIDEYDVPLDKAFQHGYYGEMVSLIRDK